MVSAAASRPAQRPASGGLAVAGGAVTPGLSTDLTSAKDGFRLPCTEILQGWIRSALFQQPLPALEQAGPFVAPQASGSCDQRIFFCAHLLLQALREEGLRHQTNRCTL